MLLLLQKSQGFQPPKTSDFRKKSDGLIMGYPPGSWTVRPPKSTGTQKERLVFLCHPFFRGKLAVKLREGKNSCLPKWKETNIGVTHFPLPWLWEEGINCLPTTRCRFPPKTHRTSKMRCAWQTNHHRGFPDLGGKEIAPPKKWAINCIPSRGLTYPTLGKGKSSSRCHFWGIC